MTIEQFNDVLHADPFRSFTIHMGDGRIFFVKHRDFIARSPSGRTVTVYAENDKLSILELLLMTELEIHASDQPGAAA
ncbi:MAG TPA: hypothetical protein VHX86_06690 [Tepidisphaeraceae bacterium]|nr:hypothetical protein [Tepidisphaeraceae bacterium]